MMPAERVRGVKIKVMDVTADKQVEGYKAQDTTFQWGWFPQQQILDVLLLSSNK